MSKLRRGSNAILAAALVALACPALALSAAGRGHIEISHQVVDVLEDAHALFNVRGSHGYKISIKGSKKGVLLVASRRHSAAIYFDDQGWADESGIHADFGELGEIETWFEEGGGSTERLPNGSLRHCRPADGMLDRFGAFVGRIEFRGEYGFTEVSRQRVRGRVSPERSLRCSERQEAGVSHHESGPGPTAVSAITFAPLVFANAGPEALSGLDGLRNIGLSLHLSSSSKRATSFVAERFGEREGISIIRIAVAGGGKASFEVDRRHGIVRVRPPRPFVGQVTYRACARRRTLGRQGWHGSLAIDLPGTRRFHLTSRRLFSIVRLTPGVPCPRWSSGS